MTANQEHEHDMASTHTIGIALSEGYRTSAMLSVKPAKKIVVFVHGFSGDAQGTWKDIPSRILKDPTFEEVDVVFFGYKSTRQAEYSAAELYDLLFNVLGATASTLYPPAVNARGVVAYENVVLVCHSLGALITRRALLLAAPEHPAWLALTKLLLFAPAHRGCDLVSLLITCLPGPSKLLGFFTQYKWPVLRDLTPGSTALDDLERDTLAHIAKNADVNIAVAYEIVWAEFEKVVIAGRFCNDPDPRRAADRNHISVCKPTDQYLLPLQRVVAAL